MLHYNLDQFIHAARLRPEVQPLTCTFFTVKVPLFINGTRLTYHVLMLILSFTVHQVLPIQSKRVTAFLQAKIHLNPGYLISGYREWGGGGGPGGGVAKKSHPPPPPPPPLPPSFLIIK